MSSPWFTANDQAFALGSTDYDTSVANILDSLHDLMTRDRKGNKVIDVDAAVLAAITEVNTISVALSLQFPWMLLGAPFREIFESLNKLLVKVQPTSDATIVPLQPLLDDCEAKAQAVTDYYDHLYRVDLKTLIDESRFGFGQLEKNVPPADDTTKEDRYYVVTHVNDWDNESAPSEVSDLVLWGKKDTVTITPATPPTGRNLSYWRVYRSNSGSQGAAFEYVGNEANELGVPIATPTFTDDVPNSKLQEACPTMIWIPPPADLCGIVAGSNGIHLGHQGRTLRPSEDFTPYAYPEEYGITIADEIVGKAAWQGMWFIGTRGRPVFVGGPSAANLTSSVVDGDQACVSERSICPTTTGVIYASPDGLCLANPGAPVRVLTLEHFTREEWQALGPENMIVEEHDGQIFIMRDNAPAASTPSFTWDAATAMIPPLVFTGTDGVVMGKSVGTSGQHVARSTFPKNTGKWYAELDFINESDPPGAWFGIADSHIAAFYPGSNAPADTNYLVYLNNGRIWKSGISLGILAPAYTTGDTIAVRLDADAGTVSFYKNNTLAYSDSLTLGLDFHLIAAFIGLDVNTWTLHRDQDGTLVYPVPGGHIAWG